MKKMREIFIAALAFFAVSFMACGAAFAGEALAFTNAAGFDPAVLEQNGAVKYYGRLEDLNAADNVFTVPVSCVADGTYTLKIFYERIDNRTNGAGEEMYSDFAGQPAALTLTVAGGAGTAAPLAVATT